MVLVSILYTKSCMKNLTKADAYGHLSPKALSWYSCKTWYANHYGESGPKCSNLVLNWAWFFFFQRQNWKTFFIFLHPLPNLQHTQKTKIWTWRVTVREQVTCSVFRSWCQEVVQETRVLKIKHQRTSSENQSKGLKSETCLSLPSKGMIAGTEISTSIFN